ncbi:hypothetical protein HGA13_14260 [Nocardia speluncae]|uniref:Uncharacterized protein n=1 Tax=Nocardia speluncae TaxID=419477 RepID=A0A846XKB1_9NOCA|nr:hypothetical protein [Nocardia speluncae]NKY34234.1 hypothetical protein [Nocardia speluncae]
MDMVAKDVDDNRFPYVEWREHWPVDRSVSAAVIPLIFALLFLALAALLFGMVPLDAGWIPVAGAAGGGLLMLGAVAAFVGKLSWLVRRRDSGVRHHVDTARGPGIRLVIGHSDQIVGLCALAGCALYGLCAWLDWKTGGSYLLPLSKSDQAGATWILVLASTAAVIGVLLAIAFRWMITVEIYPAGVARKTALPFGRSREEFIRWDDICVLRAASFDTYNSSPPMIEIEYSDSVVQSRNKLFDRPGVLGLPIHLVRCDLNSLLSIMEYLRDHGRARSLLAHPDAPQWFLRVERSGRKDHRSRGREGGVG